MKHSLLNHTSRPGFTIVELLIVIVIIGILATVTIVAYNGIQQRAQTSSLVAANNQVSKKLLAFQIEKGYYPATLSEAGIDGGTVNFQYTYNNSVNPQSFCVTSTVSSTSQKIDSGLLASTSGACAGHTNGGVAFITNLANNPSLGANASGWASASVTGASRSSIADLPGFNWAFTATTSISGSRIFLADSTATLATGTPYTASAWVKLTAGLSLNMTASDSTGTTGYGSQVPCGTGIATGAWQRCTITFTPTLATWRVSARQLSAGAGTMAVTGVMVVAGSTDYAYADGNSAGWTWTVPGSAPNSTSTGPPN